MRTGVSLFFAITIFLLLFPNITQAANKVVVLRDGAKKITMPLVRELNASGFDAQAVSAAPDADLEGVAQQENASAAIRLNLKGKQVEVWVADRMTGKIVARTVDLEPGGEPEDSIVVLAAVELLRASLMEIYAVKQPKSQVKIDADTKAFAKPAEIPGSKRSHNISVHLALGGGGAFIGAETGLSAHGYSAIVLEMYDKFQFAVVGQFPFSPHTLTPPEGTVHIYPFYWGAETVALLREPPHRLRPFIGMGMGAAVFYSTGSKSRTFEGANALISNDQSAIVPIPYIKGGVRFKATDFLFLRFDFILGVSTETTRVEVAARPVAYIGRPWISTNLSLEITLW